MQVAEEIHQQVAELLKIADLTCGHTNYLLTPICFCKRVAILCTEQITFYFVVRECHDRAVAETAQTGVQVLPLSLTFVLAVGSRPNLADLQL